MGEVEVMVPIRPAAADDLDAVHAMLADAGLPSAGLADQFEDGGVVATDGARVIGTAALETYGAYGLLRSVIVSPAERGRGVAAALVADRLAWAGARGLRAVYLLTETAEPWFAAHGFITVSRDVVPPALQRSVEFAEACPASATVMRIDVSPAASSCCDAPVLATSAPRAAQSITSCCAPAPVGLTARAAQAVSTGRGIELARDFDADDAESVKSKVREKYGAAASRAAAGSASSCCGASDAEVWDPITADLYDSGETQGLPAEALLASLGCGNPTALAQLNAGETVLDLGSGGGIDVLLSARRVGPTGYVYGVDMTDEMLELARANQQRAGVTNVEFRKGDIEHIPLPDASVDVIISNCVINLAADKPRVLAEAWRVLKPGGRFAVSDVVARRAVPDAIRQSMELWMGCVAGALQEQEYGRLLEQAGFTQIGVEPTRIYAAADARFFLEGADLDVPSNLEQFEGAFMSAFVRAVKPAEA